MKQLMIVVLLLFSAGSYAQSIEQIKADRQTYIWGEGSATTLREADQIALADIIGQITTQVESNFEKTTEESDDKFRETVRDVLKTYSNATLKNTERVVLEQEPNARVFRYVKRSEITKVFESRKSKIIDFARNGETALKNAQIADALRYFYWAQTLLRSHPEADEISMKTADGNDALLITWLPVQISQVFTDISVKIDKIEDEETYLNYLLDITYKGTPIRNMDYTFWGGQDWSNIYSAKDGVGVAELPVSNDGNDLRVKIEYSFEGEANVDMELRDVMQKLPLVPYKGSYITVAGKKLKSQQPTNVPAAVAVNTPPVATGVQGVNLASTAKSLNTGASVVQSNLGTITTLTETTVLDKIMSQVLGSIHKKTFSGVDTCFTEEGLSIFKNLLRYGNARILKEAQLKYFQYGDLVVCRSVPMSFSFQNNNRKFVEDVVFYFDKQNKISNISFGLSKKALDDIAGNDSWSEAARMVIITFMENYKTAYALKRLDYIRSIFSDDALIITGTVTRVNSSDSRFATNTIVKYNRMTKQQYMKNLEHSFRSNEFINIRFDDNTVRRSGKEKDIYGIQIKQDYFSTNYGDSGYLFLLVDLTDSVQPQIHVRTWQPEKNEDGSIYGLSDF